MQRFAEWESKGRQCVLLYCGDHDPAGLNIARLLHINLAEIAMAVGRSPNNLIVKRFGLDVDFIRRHRLSWIPNLITGSGGRLDDPRHPDHFKPYVQDYLAQFGARKVEANALVVRPDAGRALCRAAISEYLNEAGIRKFQTALRVKRAKLAAEITRQLAMRQN